MAPQDVTQPESPQSDPDPEGSCSQDVEQVVREFVSSFERLRQRARELEEQNRALQGALDDANRKNRELLEARAELQAALKQANERIVRFEQLSSTVPELSRFAVTTAAQMLAHAVEAVDSMRKAVQVESTARDEEARKRALQLQMEALALVEKARDEATRRILETNQKAVEILRRTRESILIISEDLEKQLQGQQPPGASGARVGMPAGAGSGASTGPVSSPAAARSGQPSSVAASEGQAAAGKAAVPASREATGRAAEALAANGKVEIVKQLEEQLSQLVETLPPRPEAPASGQPAVTAVGRGDETAAGKAEAPAPEQPIRSAEGRPRDVIELVASPFRDFASLSGFFRAIKQLPNVVDVQPLGFENGAIRLAIRYSTPVAPVAALLGLSQFNLRLVSVGADRIEVAVVDRQGSPEDQPSDNR